MGRELVVSADAATLAGDVAARLLERLAQVQRGGRRAALALTAGSIMEQVWQALAATPPSATSAVDWSRVDIFWGDERFVPHDSSDRNDGPADRILFAHPPFSSARRYPMPASDGAYGDDLDAAAAGYADQLSQAKRPGDQDAVPNFDVVLLGIGPDGHCCSLFPDHPSARDESGPVIPVRNSPKPPPLRISLSFTGLNAADQIWVIASGTGKADAVARALGGADRTTVPSAGAQGRQRTLWLVDREAAAQLPEIG
jgi:6-phosphogluconolactonase